MVKIFIDNKKYALDIKDLYTMLTGDRKVVVKAFEIKNGKMYLEDGIQIDGFKNTIYLIRKFEENFVLYHYNYDDENEPIFRLTYTKNYGEKDKNVYKRLLFDCLKKETKLLRSSWGTLTGIRPVKIVNDLKKAGYDKSQIDQRLINNYYLSNEKIDLITKISDNQEKAIKTLQNALSIYIFIPFCPSRCYYCSFYSNDISLTSKYATDYLDTLEKEIKETLKLPYFNGKKISTIYIGGGTPSSLDEKNLTKLFEIIKNNFDLNSIKEFTFEAGRADTLDEKKLHLIKNAGVNRICLNPQTMKDETLKTIGRTHSVAEFVDIFKLARKIGFDNINCDLILGLIGESETDMKTSLQKVIDLAPENITIHTLAKKRTAVLNQENIGFDDFDISPLMDEMSNTLYNKKYFPYYLYRQKNMINSAENIGFSKKGYICLYNIAMMDEVQTVIGFGAGASSKIIDGDLVTRIPNYKDLLLYIKDIENMIQRKKGVLLWKHFKELPAQMTFFLRT